MTQLGVQLYSVREQMQADPGGVLGRLAEIGYRAVEPTLGLLGGDPAAFRELLDARGLTACALHGPALGPLLDDIAAAALAIGTDTVVVPAIPASEFTTSAGISRSARRLTEAAAWLGDRGLKLAYHNHYWELANRPGGQTGLELLADLLPASVALEVDVYWAAVGGADVPSLLGRLGDRVRLLHVKDGPATVDGAMTAVGAGTLPIPSILAAAPPDAWRIVELDRCDADIFAALTDSYVYLAGQPAAATAGERG